MPLPHSNSWPCMAVTVMIWTHDLQVMGQFLLHLLGSWISLALVHLYYVMIVSGCLCEVRCVCVCVRVRWSLKSIPIGDCKCLWSRSPIRDHRPQGLYLLLYLSRVCFSAAVCRGVVHCFRMLTCKDSPQSPHKRPKPYLQCLPELLAPFHNNCIY